MSTIQKLLVSHLDKGSLHTSGLVFLQNSASTSGSRPAEEEEEKLVEALQIKGLLGQNTEEMASILRALNGEYIEPQAGGDLLRDGAGVLPTGRGKKRKERKDYTFRRQSKKKPGSMPGCPDTHR